MRWTKCSQHAAQHAAQADCLSCTICAVWQRALHRLRWSACPASAKDLAVVPFRYQTWRCSQPCVGLAQLPPPSRCGGWVMRAVATKAAESAPGVAHWRPRAPCSGPGFSAPRLTQDLLWRRVIAGPAAPQLWGCRTQKRPTVEAIVVMRVRRHAQRGRHRAAAAAVRRKPHGYGVLLWMCARNALGATGRHRCRRGGQRRVRSRGGS